MPEETIEGYRLSPQQKHLWLSERTAGGSRAQCAVIMRGRVDVGALQAAWAGLIKRHESLRTAFVSVAGVDLPLQVIRESVAAVLEEVELRSEETEQKGWEELWGRKFELESGEVVRGRLVRVGDEEQVLLVSVSGMCADVRTMKHLVAELGRGYEAALAGAELGDEPVQYADFSEWQNALLESEEEKEGRAFWESGRSAEQEEVRLPWEKGGDEERSDGESALVRVEVSDELL